MGMTPNTVNTIRVIAINNIGIQRKAASVVGEMEERLAGLFMAFRT
jgi:hypothetical protein